MWFGINDYQAEWVMKERMRDALREAEQMRLIRTATGATRRRERWSLVTSALERLRAITTHRGPGKPRCQSQPAAPGATCNCSAS